MMTFPLIATSVESHSHSFLDALPHLAGMAMVMVALTFLWGVCALTARIVQMFVNENADTAPTASGNPTVAPVQAEPAQAAAAVSNAGIAPEIVAVIAAAVASIHGNRPVHIVSIKPMNTGWERAGRQAVLTSHRIR